MTILADQLRHRLAATLLEQVTDSGHRLGVIVEHGDSDAERDAAGLLRTVGLAPDRRLARLRPRVGEHVLRADDLAHFASRYGHEYVAAILRFETFSSDDDRNLIEAALRGEGCEVAWH